MTNKDGFFKPPRIAEYILGCLFPDEKTFTTMGDLEEAYNDVCRDKGRFRARIWYYWQLLSSLYLFIYWRIVMLKNSILYTFRLIKKDKFHNFLNILGLSSGIACGIIIFLYLQNELTYDGYHEKSDRIYRIYSTYVTSGEPIKFAPTSPALGPSLKKEFPEVEEYVRIAPSGQLLFVQKERDITFYEQNVFLADPSIFNVFSYEFLLGDPGSCLKDPQNIVLTEKLARKYFGNNDPMGKVLQVDNQRDLLVSGVIKNPPANSHLTIEAIVSYSTWDRNNQSLTWPMFEIYGFTYVLLPPNYNFAGFNEKWPAFYEKYCAETGKRYGQVFKPVFQKITDIRYDPTRIRWNVPIGSRFYLYAFFYIGIFILVLASINYINLTTARSAVRAKEVGIKKVLGSERRNLIFQILGESFLVNLLALVSAFVLVRIFLAILPVERLLDVKLQINFLKNPLLLAGSLGVFILIGLASGLYPAFYISSFLPIRALSGSFMAGGKKGLIIRRILVISQFVISIGVVVLMLFMNDQIDFMRSKYLGFKKENVIFIPLRDNSLAQRMPALKKEFLQYPGIISVSNGITRPGFPGTGLYRLEGTEGMVEHNYYVFVVGYDYLDTLGLELSAGRDFDEQHTTDPTKAVIVNETLVKAMGWKNPLGKRITQVKFEAEVIGVVKDFNFRSLHNQIEPLIFRMQVNNPDALILKTRGENIKQILDFLKDKWKTISPNRPFEYSFLDEEWGRLYEADQRQSQLIKLFSYVCALISCLGLLGLSSFNAIRRTKEIAIRKVHGASSVRIVLVLFKEIFALIVTASIVVFPVSLILINLWRANFAYRTGINIWLFMVTAAGALLIAFFTASYHCIKVANTNPVKSLRYE